jgi:hypothetical protein
MVPVLEPTVAKKKGKPVPAEPDDSGRKPMVVQVRGSQEWKAWVEELAEIDGIPLAMMVDRALRLYARHLGFDKTPPKR